MWAVVILVALAITSIALIKGGGDDGPRIDPTGKQVLILGDSLSVGPNSPGVLLGKLLKGKGANVRVNSRVGRSAWNFFNREDATGILRSEAAHRPNLVILFLGTNALGLNLVLESRRQGKIAGVFPGAEIWAIGPPVLADKAKAEAVVDMMRDRFAPRFIDLRLLTNTGGRTADGVHFTKAGARRLVSKLDRTYIR